MELGLMFDIFLNPSDFFQGRKNFGSDTIDGSDPRWALLILVGMSQKEVYCVALDSVALHCHCGLQAFWGK